MDSGKWKVFEDVPPSSFHPSAKRPSATSHMRTLIGVVGPCCAGKSTLVPGLEALGYTARHIAQEHSYTPRMWQIISQPDVLVFLDVSYPVAQQRRWMNWKPEDLAEQQRRLRHAREHCDLYLHTDALTPQQVLKKVQEFLQSLHAE